MRKTIVCAAAAAALVGLIRPAFAETEQPGRAGRCGLMEKADTNQDGAVTFEELTAACPNATREKFDRWDGNGDGVLNQSDRPAPDAGKGGKRHGGKPGAQGLRRADANEDGKVTYEEMIALKPDFPRETYDRLDTNKDGVLSQEDRRGGEGPGQGRHHAAGRRGQLFERLRAADANSDGQVTFEEVQTTMPKLSKEKFERLDRNSDGVLNQEDRKPLS
jgi:hypothetical protein